MSTSGCKKATARLSNLAVLMIAQGVTSREIIYKERRRR